MQGFDSVKVGKTCEPCCVDTLNDAPHIDANIDDIDIEYMILCEAEGVQV